MQAIRVSHGQIVVPFSVVGTPTPDLQALLAAVRAAKRAAKRDGRGRHV